MTVGVAVGVTVGRCGGGGGGSDGDKRECDKHEMDGSDGGFVGRDDMRSRTEEMGLWVPKHEPPQYLKITR